MGTDVFKIVDNQPVLFGYILSVEEIDRKVVEKIREKYSNNDENKFARITINSIAAGGGLPNEFTEYVNFVESCRVWGDEQKLLAASQLAALIEVEIPDGEGTRKIWVKE